MRASDVVRCGSKLFGGRGGSVGGLRGSGGAVEAVKAKTRVRTGLH